MYGSEVEKWLYSIGAPELFDFFLEDGFTTLDAVRRMRQSDIDAIVDRKGFIIMLNEGIDRLNYELSHVSHSAPRAVSYIDSYEQPETREALMNRYECGIPTGGSLARTLARQTKSKSRKLRGLSAMPESTAFRSYTDRYVPNSASDAYERLLTSRRAKSVAFSAAKEASLTAAEAALVARQRRTLDRNQRAQSGKSRNFPTTKPNHSNYPRFN